MLFAIVLLVSFPALSFAGEKVIEDVLFSVDVQDEPLGSVCKKITQLTGYRILIDEKWKDIPVSASVKGVSLHEGLMRILGKYNTVINVDAAEKKCEVMIFERSGSIAQITPIPKGKVLAAKDGVISSNHEIIPPGEGNRRGLTVKQIEEMMARGAAGGGEDVQVAPPGGSPGGKGLTKREIEAMMTQRPSPEQEVVPPNFSGKRGLTVAEIEAMMKQRPSPEQEVVPPNFSGKRGLTVQEIEAMMQGERKDNDRAFPVLPPQSENKREGGK